MQGRRGAGNGTDDFLAARAAALDVGLLYLGVGRRLGPGRKLLRQGGGGGREGAARDLGEEESASTAGRGGETGHGRRHEAMEVLGFGGRRGRWEVASFSGTRATENDRALLLRRRWPMTGRMGRARIYGAFGSAVGRLSLATGLQCVLDGNSKTSIRSFQERERESYKVTAALGRG